MCRTWSPRASVAWFVFSAAVFAWAGGANAGPLTLIVDRATRDAFLENANTEPQVIGGYQIDSKAGATTPEEGLLAPAGWRSINDYFVGNATEALAAFGSGVGSFAEIFSGPDGLFEGSLSGSVTFAPGFRFSIGKPVREFRDNDLVFQVLLDNGSVVNSDIRIIDSSKPWHNLNLAQDVDGNGRVTISDVLTLVDRINEVGSGVLPTPSAGDSPPPYYDVDNDSRLNGSDVLNVIDAIEAAPAPTLQAAANMQQARFAAVIPEPSGFGLCMVAAVLLLGAHQRRCN